MAVILPVVQGVIRITHKGLLQGLPYVNTFHVQGTLGNYTQQNITDVATAMHAAYFAHFIPILNTGTSLQTTTAEDLTSRTQPVAMVGPAHNGTITPAMIPANSLAVCISWAIQDRYRGGHPRMYLPLGDGQDVTAGRTLSATYLPTVVSAAAAYLGAAGTINIGGQQFAPVCVRYFSNKQLLAVPFVRPINSSSVHTRVDSMRRRTGKETG